MNSKRKPRINRTGYALAFSFLIPLIVMLIYFFTKGIAPFGDRSLCAMDGYSQYYPMLQNMGQSIMDGELFYSFKGALGYNLWVQNAYYTNNPLWLILYLLPHSIQLSAIDIIIVLQVCLSGLFFCVRLIKSRKDTSDTAFIYVYPALSTAWALSGYTVAFMNQFMWLPVVMLLPLVVLGIELLFEKGKSGLYILALFFSMWCCFYLSYMVCVFICLYFIYLALKNRTPFKDFLKKGSEFAFSSVLAAGLCAVVLVPVAIALSKTHASDLAFEGSLEIRYNLLELVSRFAPFQKSSLEYGSPNLYCSILVPPLCILALMLGNNSRRTKLLSFAFIMFMLFSMSINLGEYIWHGFHYPNQLPARQSFLVIFLLLSFAAEGLLMKKMEKKLAILFAVVMIAEVSLSGFYIMLSCTWATKNDSLQRHEAYMNEVFSPLESNDETEFYRMEWTNSKRNNHPQQYFYNGVSYYSSTMSAEAFDFFEKMGMPKYAKNVSTHYTQSDILNALFSLRYISHEIPGRPEWGVVEENKNYLPLAFLADTKATQFKPEDYADGETAQKALWESLWHSDENADFKERISFYKQNGINLTLFDTDLIKGEINCRKSGLLMTSIPQDGGWEIIIDGEKVKTQKVASYLLCCEIDEGVHTVEFRYTVPGIKAGFAISLLCIFILSGYAFLRRKRKQDLPAAQ